MKIKLIEFDVKVDSRGSLVSLEGDRNIPFPIKRIYYIFDTKDGVKRGFHAHKKLKQVLICISGSCKIMLDDGKEKKVVDLNGPEKGLLIDSVVWREMLDFSPNCVLMVLVDDYYNEDDYIRNYEDFLELIKL